MLRRALLLALLAACSKSDKPAKSDHVDKPAPPPRPAKHAPTAAAFGKTVAPYGALAKFHVGMTEAEAKAAAPDFWGPKGNSRLVDSDLEDLDLGVQFIDGKLDSLRVANLGKTPLAPILKQAWGPGIDAHDSINRAITVWLDPATHWRAIVEGDPGDLELTKYLPAAELLGTDPVQFAAFGKPILGATAADLARDYPGVFTVKNPAQQAADAKKAQDVAKWAGASDKDTALLAPTAPIEGDAGDLRLPPTEWGRFDTVVSPMFDKGKVEHYFFTITDDGYPPGRDEVLALMKKKWGEPKIVKTYKESLVFHKSDPWIEAERDASDKGWEINVRQKPED